MASQEFRIDLHQVDDFEFRVRFGETEAADLTVDEAPPLGKGRGPNPTRLLAAAVGNCLAASLLFCVRRARGTIGSIEGQVQGTLVRNDRGRWRIGGLAVTLKLADTSQAVPALDACLAEFEDFCIVTQSVRRGVPVTVQVLDRDGRLLSTGETTSNSEGHP